MKKLMIGGYLISILLAGYTQPMDIDITKHNWNVWLDASAVWENDKLFAPPYNLNLIPSNNPTCGWENLNAQTTVMTKLPCSIEELFSKGVNTWTYHGVSWFWISVDIPENWQGKQVLLRVENARQRLEVYVNENLAGYDLVDETFYITEISKFLNPDEANTIAFRITNPGGVRGWADFPGTPWGDYELPASHDFSGIGGKVTLSAVPDIYISDVFIKNLQPFEEKKIDVISTIDNHEALKGNVEIELEIKEKETGKQVFKKRSLSSLNGSTEQLDTLTVSVEDARYWTLEDPNLYKFTVKIEKEATTHEKTVVSGFRVIESRVVNDKHNFYLNGKRLRLRSAIDWGYYALTGLYATDNMAFKSVKAARDIGHNGINFHRRIGEPLVFKYANEMGLYLYEEPGGFHSGGQGYTIYDSTITAQLMVEKCRRMVLRDRNHPSLLFYNLANEDQHWDAVRERAMTAMNRMDNSRFIFNSSGGNGGGPGTAIRHTRPYESEIRMDCRDLHTVKSESRFQESDLHTPNHSHNIDNSLLLYGEVRCYAGPDNSYAIVKDFNHEERIGYDLNIYKPMHDKLERFFNDFNLAESGSKLITSPEMITKQAGRGLMYIDGRLGQTILANNSSDGYAINGWSGGPQVKPAWASAILDEGRNLKGPAEDFAYWVRDLQVAIFRKNGKYFQPGDSIKFDLHLINEGKLPGGNYLLKIRVIDGAGEFTGIEKQLPVEVEGGDTYAQLIASDFTVFANENWHPGYITIQGELYQNEQLMTDGAEQILLQNRKAYKSQLSEHNIFVYNWKEAREAIQDAGRQIADLDSAEIILAGEPGDHKEFSSILEKVSQHGAKTIIRFDSIWSDVLVKESVLKTAPVEWGGVQTRFWNGNGWGYIDHFVGNQVIPSKTIIGTNSWEVPSDPYGFWPFKSDHELKVYGAFFARLDKILILAGEINYGSGKILLLPTYPVDENNAFNDLIFYNAVFN